MEHATPPLSSQYRGRRLDFVVALVFWAALVCGYLTCVCVRARILIAMLSDIDEIREEAERHAGNFELPMLDICELSKRGSLLDKIEVQASASFRDPKNGTATSQTNIVKKMTIQPMDGSVNDGVRRKTCKDKRKNCPMIDYHCRRFDPRQKIPEDAEQVDGEYIIRPREDFCQRQRLFCGSEASLKPARLYKGRQGLYMISGFFFRLSLAKDMGHPIAFEQEMMRHVGVPLRSGLRIVDVLARPFRYEWKDTMGGRYGAKHNDTSVLDVSQFTRFEPIANETDARVELRFILATTVVEVVEHVNTVMMNVVYFLKDCASMTVVFTAMGVAFTFVRKVPVQKRFFLTVCGLGSPDPAEEEPSPTQKDTTSGDGGPAAPPEPAEERRPSAKPGSALAGEPRAGEEGDLQG